MSGETKIIFNRQPRNAEEILKSCTNSKYKLLKGSRTTWQCIVWTFVVHRQAPKHTQAIHTHVLDFKASESVPGRNESKFSKINRTIQNHHCQCRWLSSRHAVASELHGDFESCFGRRSHTVSLSAGEDSHRCLLWGVGSNTSWASESPIAKEKGRDF